MQVLPGKSSRRDARAPAYAQTPTHGTCTAGTLPIVRSQRASKAPSAGPRPGRPSATASAEAQGEEATQGPSASTAAPKAARGLSSTTSRRQAAPRPGPSGLAPQVEPQRTHAGPAKEKTRWPEVPLLRREGSVLYPVGAPRTVSIGQGLEVTGLVAEGRCVAIGGSHVAKEGALAPPLGPQVSAYAPGARPVGIAVINAKRAGPAACIGWS